MEARACTEYLHLDIGERGPALVVGRGDQQRHEVLARRCAPPPDEVIRECVHCPYGLPAQPVPESDVKALVAWILGGAK